MKGDGIRDKQEGPKAFYLKLVYNTKYVNTYGSGLR